MKGKPIQAGCLALIIGSKNCPENIGRVVRVVGRPDPGWAPPESGVTNKPVPYGKDVWVVQVMPGHPPLHGIVVSLTTRAFVRKYASQFGAFVEPHLMRIDDDSQDEPKTLKAPRPKDEVI